MTPGASHFPERSWQSRALTTLFAVGVLLIEPARGQDGAITWIPTRGQNSLLAQLGGVNVADLSKPDTALSIRGILGVIPVDQVGGFITSLTQDPGKRTLSVRWTNNGAQCTLNKTSCTRALTVTVNEFSFGAADASDCQAVGVVTVDAALPRHAVLSDGSQAYLPDGQPQYLISSSPNSTEGACTYVVSYPPATVKLASLACDQNCRTSPCLQCADSVTGVVAQSACNAGPGIPTALQAALEGAAQCLAGGPISPAGRFQCNIQADANASTCGSMSCFPGHATVQLLGGGRRAMRDLRVGDKVKAVAADGSVIHSPVYFFGHQDPAARGSFVQLTLGQLQEAPGGLQHPRKASGSTQRKLLELSPLHFVPAMRRLIGSAQLQLSSTVQGPELLWRERVMRRAGDVAVGDVMWVEVDAGDGQGRSLQPHRVLARVLKQRWGAYNPYTLEGSIVVDDVVASSHSEWLLDPLFDALGLTHWLPNTYQVLFAPLRWAYHILGPQAMQGLDASLDLAGLGRTPSPKLVSSVAALLSAGACGFAIKRLHVFMTR